MRQQRVVAAQIEHQIHNAISQGGLDPNQVVREVERVVKKLARSTRRVDNFDFEMSVNRSEPSSLPEWSTGLLRPELATAGPDKYNLIKDVEPWTFHEGRTDLLEKEDTYEYLKATQELWRCLNLQDGIAIKSKGIDVFRAAFPYDEKVFLLGTIVSSRRKGDRPSAPCLYDGGGEGVVLAWEEIWNSLDYSVYHNHRALRFKNK